MGGLTAMGGLVHGSLPKMMRKTMFIGGIVRKMMLIGGVLLNGAHGIMSKMMLTMVLSNLAAPSAFGQGQMADLVTICSGC